MLLRINLEWSKVIDNLLSLREYGSQLISQTKKEV